MGLSLTIYMFDSTNLQKLPEKQTLYDTHLTVFRTQLSQLFPLYYKDQSLIFIILAFLDDNLFSRQSFTSLVTTHCPLSPEEECADREQGLDLYRDTAYDERNMPIIRSAAGEIISRNPEAGNLYAQASSLLLQSYCVQYNSGLQEWNHETMESQM